MLESPIIIELTKLNSPVSGYHAGKPINPIIIPITVKATISLIFIDLPKNEFKIYLDD